VKLIDLKRFLIFPLENKIPEKQVETVLIQITTKLALYILKIVDALENKFELAILEPPEMIDLQNILISYQNLLQKLANEGRFPKEWLRDCLLDEDDD